MSGLRDIKLTWSKLRIQDPSSGDLDVGYVQGLWKDDYDPLTAHTWNDDEKTAGIFTDAFMSAHHSDGWKQMLEFYQRTGFKVWQINPYMVESVRRQAERSSTFGQNVISVKTEASKNEQMKLFRERVNERQQCKITDFPLEAASDSEDADEDAYEDVATENRGGRVEDMNDIDGDEGNHVLPSNQEDGNNSEDGDNDVPPSNQGDEE
ncbi:hypothetical protein ACHAQJ_000947 [Trichoderma viride]